MGAPYRAVGEGTGLGTGLGDQGRRKVQGQGKAKRPRPSSRTSFWVRATATDCLFPVRLARWHLPRSTSRLRYVVGLITRGGGFLMSKRGFRGGHAGDHSGGLDLHLVIWRERDVISHLSALTGTSEGGRFEYPAHPCISGDSGRRTEQGTRPHLQLRNTNGGQRLVERWVESNADSRPGTVGRAPAQVPILLQHWTAACSRVLLERQ